MKLAMYKGKGRIGNAITRWWTGSIYSHCELIIDGVCYSASFMDGGIRAKAIDVTNGKWDVIDIPWSNKEYALELFSHTKGDGYDWLGIFGSQVINKRVHSIRRWFCSEWCGAALGMPNPETRSPLSLYELVLFMNERLKND